MNDEQQIIEPVPTMAGYKKIPTFKLWIANQFPYIETDFDAITNYDLLQAVIKYLNTIIENENNVESNVTALYNAFVNLHNYVEEQFDSLNLQDEVNTKIDEMYESGLFDNLLNNYLNLTKVFDTYNDMMLDTSTYVNGMKLKTLGYHYINDGGGAEYVVTNVQNDNKYQVSIGTNLWIEMIIKDYVNIKQLGAKGDGITDDSQSFIKALNYAKSNNYKLYVPSGSYIITETITIDMPNFEIFGDGKNKSILHFNKNSNDTFFDLQQMYFYAHDLQFYGLWENNQTCFKNVNSSNRSARNRFINIKIRNFKNGINLSNYSDCNVLRGIDFHLVANCIYIKQNDNGIIEDCTAEPFTQVFCELFQANCCAIRNCLVNTSDEIFDSTSGSSCAFILTGNETGSSGQKFGTSITIENIHSEYIGQFALIGISNVSIRDIYIFNNDKISSKHMIHFMNYAGNNISNIFLKNIIYDLVSFDTNYYGIYKANYSETSVVAPNGKTYNTRISGFNNINVDGYNSTFSIPNELATNVYSDYTIKNKRVTCKNGQLYLVNKGITIPNMSNFNDYLFERTIDSNTIFECSKFKFRYNPTQQSWTPYPNYSVYNLQGVSVDYTPRTKNGTVLISCQGNAVSQYINIVATIRNGTIQGINTLNSSVLSAAINDNKITFTSTSYQNPFTITENVINS